MTWRWLAYTGDGIEFFTTREEAEAHVLDWYTDAMHDSGEGVEDLGWVAQVVSHCVEVVSGHAEDGTEVGEECRARGVDYLIDGYRMEES